MPELPEVETVVRAVRSRVQGARLFGVRVNDPKLRSRRLQQLSTRITEVRRHGKYIIWELANGEAIVIHLRMTGNLIWRSKPGQKALGGAVIRHSLSPESITPPRCEFVCEGGSVLFADTRRFGTVEIFSSNQLASLPGVDPFESTFSLKTFLELLRASKQTSRSQKIKPWLLRQDKVAGIGNIYASEILFDAQISPLRKVASITEPEARRIYQSLVKILNKAIKHCGTTFSDFRGFDGETGAFQRFLKVYDRAGQPCRRCHFPVKKVVQAGRSTFYCSNCVK